MATTSGNSAQDAGEIDFDVVVVGAGIAGCVAAYQLAKAGKSVVLIERGSTPGSKNLSGGVLYCKGIRSVFPEFLDDAPYERRVSRNIVTFLNAGSSVSLDYRDQRLAEPVNAVTVLRARLDPWLAQKCEEVGVFMMPGVRVDRFLTTGGVGGQRVIGVKAGDDELRSRVVVAADGVNSFLARDFGLRSRPSTNQIAVGVKSVVKLSAEQIGQRFNVTEREGVAMALVGDCTEGIGGGGFMYTNVESISIGLVLRLDDMVAQRGDATDLFERFLANPSIAPYLAGGEMIEYGSHLVAEGGYQMVGEIAADGLVVIGDAAGLTLNTGLTVRGMDLAVASAVAAAHGIVAALDRGNTSKVGLAAYRQTLMASAAGADLRTYAKAPAFLERDRMYKDYGALVADILYGEFNVDEKPHRRTAGVVREALKRSPVGWHEIISDAIAGGRAL